jgi:excisionase family DNA binding protein/PAS domain S-box-containing protein
VTVNLKAASQRLGAHYQTAYKWVRSGELTAVRVGSRYEVSAAAVHQFNAARASFTADRLGHEPAAPVGDVPPEDFLEALEVMASDPVVTIPSAAAFAARQGAEVLGDLCLIVFMNDDGVHVEHAAIGHAEPHRAAFVGAVIGLLGPQPNIGNNIVSTAYLRGAPLRASHVSQDVLWHGLLPELHQYLADYSIHAVLSAPIVSEGRTTGFVAFSRDTASRPYTADDEQLAIAIGERLGVLGTTAVEIARAWQIRSELANDIRMQIAQPHNQDPLTAEDVARIFEDHPRSGALPVAVFDAEGRVIGVNDMKMKTMGYTADAVVGKTSAVFTHADDLAQESADFARLISGELDYLDVHSRRLRADGTVVDYATHRVAVRNPDASLNCIVAVGRALRGPTSHDPVGPGVTRGDRARR